MKITKLSTAILLNLFSLFLIFGSVKSQDSLFDVPMYYDVGDVPLSIISNDFNGDGNYDLATANIGSENISILLGNGDGTFQNAVNYLIGGGPNSVFSIDFDGDGDNDLATANFSSSNISILLGNGDGTFQNAVDYDIGNYPNSIFSIDFNGDGNNDLATANSFFFSDVSILLGNGDGTFQSAVSYSAGDGPYSVFSIDFNGDSNYDLAITNVSSSDISILLGNGDGTFQSAVNYAVGDYPGSVFSIDFNGDGINDLATANEFSDNVSILLGNGDGTFQGAVNYVVGNEPQSIFSIDFDGDGDNDLATANEKSDNVSILLGNGDGTFQSAVNYAVGEQPISVFSTDFNGDGDYDLATANASSDNVSILLNLTGSYEGCCIGFAGNVNCSEEEIPDISDITRLIDYLYLSQNPLCCVEEADANGSGGEPDISDITRLIDYLYLSNAPLPYCPVIDIDGNVYKTVTLGSQVWMAENLKVTHYRNGDVIPNVTDSSEWAGLTTGAYCEYDNDITNVANYGRLYNWYAVDDSRGLAPEGWHVPSDAEWQTLVDFLGGDDVAGGKMKEVDTTHWISPNIGATNESGFSALPGGYRYNYGEYNHIGTNADFWSTTESFSSDYIYFRFIRNNTPDIFIFDVRKPYGFSIRCVKD